MLFTLIFITFLNLIKTLLMKIPHSWNIRFWRYQSGTNIETSSILTSFCSAGICYEYYRERKAIICFTYLWTLPRIIKTKLAKFAHLCNSDITVMGITNIFQIWFTACSRKWNSCLVLFTKAMECVWFWSQVSSIQNSRFSLRVCYCDKWNCILNTYLNLT